MDIIVGVILGVIILTILVVIHELGHAHITSTQVYTHLDFQHLTKIYDTTHPRAKKRD